MRRIRIARRRAVWWWRVIDSGFGIVSFVPAFLCHRWTDSLEASSSR